MTRPRRAGKARPALHRCSRPVGGPFATFTRASLVVGKNRRILRWVVAACGVSIVVGVGMLKALPYSSSLIRHVPSDTHATPSDTGFDVGGFRWDLTAYRADPTLEPLRAYRREQCGDRRGYAAALCLTSALLRDVPYGAPPTEFFDTTYRPERALALHIAGAPGHCTTRSGLLAASLLAEGDPARVVQFVPLRPISGHNAVEVWDTSAGWVLIDPSFGSVPLRNGSPTSISTAASSAVVWSWPVGKDTRRPDDELIHSAILYPEPWLYMRTGPRVAVWPFRGAFVQTEGGVPWNVGPAHRVVHGVLLASLAVGLVAGALLLRAWRAGRSSAVGEGQGDDEGPASVPARQG